MGRALALGAFLYGFWLILSGHLEPDLMFLGLLSVSIAVYVALRMQVVDGEGVPYQMFGRFLVYLGWLFKETLVSNIQTAKIILAPSLPISPTMFRYKASQKTDVGRVVYANSITFTPGTITIHVEGDVFQIHSLTWVHPDREGDEMDRWVTWVEQGGKR